MQFRRVQVGVLLARRPDFAEPSAGEHVRANGAGRGLRCRCAFGLDLDQNQIERGKLPLGQADPGLAAGPMLAPPDDQTIVTPG